MVNQQTVNQQTVKQTKKKPDIIPTIIAPSVVSSPDNTKVEEIQIILVDEEYEIENGVSGMQRDIILRLCCLFPDKVKLIIGMSKEHYQWKDHSHFLKGRPSNGIFRSSPRSETMNKSRTSEGVRFEFSKNQAIFLDLLIVKGIWKWKVKIKYQLGNSSFYFCVVPADYLFTVDSSSFVNGNGTCSLYFGVDSKGELFSMLFGLDGYRSVLAKDILVPNNAVLAAEVDADARTISFFVNKKRARRVITDLHIPLYLGVVGNRNATGSERSAFTSLSVCRLKTATPSSLPYEYIKCNPMELAKEEKNKRSFF